MLRIKFLVTKIASLILFSAILQSCSAKEQARAQEYSVYSVGDYNNNLVISDGKYVGFWSDGYAIHKNNPTEDIASHGIEINRSESPDGKCISFRNTISFGVGAHVLQTCGGYVIRKIQSQGGISLYFAFCPATVKGCPGEEFEKKPMYAYGVGNNSELLFFRFDPTSSDSKPYQFKSGTPFRLAY